jgi:hypothetical protein
MKGGDHEEDERAGLCGRSRMIREELIEAALATGELRRDERA